MKKWEERIREERRELAETLLSRREFIALSTLTQLNMLYKPSFNVSQAHSYFKFHWEHIWLFFIIGEANGEDVGKPTSYTDLSLVGCACNTHLWVLYYLFTLPFTLKFKWLCQRKFKTFKDKEHKDNTLKIDSMYLITWNRPVVLDILNHWF